jgi:hypothetical protein
MTTNDDRAQAGLRSAEPPPPEDCPARTPAGDCIYADLPCNDCDPTRALRRLLTDLAWDDAAASCRLDGETQTAEVQP